MVIVILTLFFDVEPFIRFLLTLKLIKINKAMAQKKIIVVFGATGAQGGGLAHAILNDHNSEFSVRAVTRDLNSDKAKALSEGMKNPARRERR